MLNLCKYVFISTDFAFIFDAGASADDKQTKNPNFVKVFGFALDYNFNPVSCYFMEDFSVFGLSKEDLSAKLKSHPCFKGLGSVSNDKQYRKRINLDNYAFHESFDFSDIVSFD